MPLDRRVVSGLVDVVGPTALQTDPDAVAPYCRDWTGRFQGHTPAVVLPGSTAEVAAVVALCRAAGVSLVPQGGNTGLVGGGVPLGGEVVVSLKRLVTVGEADGGGSLTVGAGTTLAGVQHAAAAAGWAYGVDFASRDQATVGGTIATNAGGPRVLRHGDTRAQVIGLEAVLGDGSVVSHLGGPVKDNTGYHLPSLLCGSEGTLGVVTVARLRLVPRADERAVCLLAFHGLGAAVAAAAAVRRDLPEVEALEVMSADALALVCEVTGLPAPFPGRAYDCLLVEAAGRRPPAAALAEVVACLPGVAGSVGAVDAGARAQLWRYRYGIPAAVNTLGAPVKLDVALPADRLSDFLVRAPEVVAGVAPGSRTWLFGHAGDGNVHLNVTGTGAGVQVEEAVLRQVVGMGGSISGEHGIGTAKRAWLGLARSPEEIAAFRALKRALDPDGILNPAALLPAPGP